MAEEVDSILKQLMDIVKECKEIPVLAEEVSFSKIVNVTASSNEEKVLFASAKLMNILVEVTNRVNAEWAEERRPLNNVKFKLFCWRQECAEYLEALKGNGSKKKKGAMQEEGETLVKKLQKILKGDAAEVYLGAYNIDTIMEHILKEGSAKLKWATEELGTLLAEAEEDRALEIEVRKAKYGAVDKMMEKLDKWQTEFENHLLKRNFNGNEVKMKRIHEEIQRRREMRQPK